MKSAAADDIVSQAIFILRVNEQQEVKLCRKIFFLGWPMN